MQVKFVNLDGKKFELQFNEDITVPNIRQKLLKEYNYNTDKCYFCRLGKILTKEKIPKETFSQQNPDIPIVIFNYQNYPDKSFPKVDDAFRLNFSRYDDFFINKKYSNSKISESDLSQIISSSNPLETLLSLGLLPSNMDISPMNLILRSRNRRQDSSNQLNSESDDDDAEAITESPSSPRITTEIRINRNPNITDDGFINYTPDINDDFQNAPRIIRMDTRNGQEINIPMDNLPFLFDGPAEFDNEPIFEDNMEMDLGMMDIIPPEPELFEPEETAMQDQLSQPLMQPNTQEPPPPPEQPPAPVQPPAPERNEQENQENGNQRFWQEVEVNRRPNDDNHLRPNRNGLAAIFANAERRQNEINQQIIEGLNLNITLNENDNQAISRLCQAGYDRATVIQVYEACDRNEESAMNLLVAMGD